MKAWSSKKVDNTTHDAVVCCCLCEGRESAEKERAIPVTRACQNDLVNL